MKRSFIILLLVIFGALGSSLPVSAQTQQEQGGGTTVSTVTVVATVEITDLTLERQAGNTFRVNYTMSNTIGAQSGIRTGLYIDDDETDGIYGTFIPGGTTDTLGQGQMVKKFGTFSIPDFYRGKTVSVYVMAMNESGLPLARVLADQITVGGESMGRVVFSNCVVSVGEEEKTYPSSYGVDIRPDETMKVMCDAENQSQYAVRSVELDVTTYLRSVLNTPLRTEVIAADWAFEPGEAKKVSFNLKPTETPQAYHVIATPKMAFPKNSILFQYVTAGPSATIQNLKLNKNFYTQGENALVYLFFTESAQNYPNNRLGRITEVSTVRIVLTSGDGQVCGEIEQSKPLNKNTYFTVPVSRDCAAPQVTATIVDGTTGTSLDSDTVSTQGLSFDEKLNTAADEHVAQVKSNDAELTRVATEGGISPRSKMGPVVGLLIVFALLAVVYVLYMWKKRTSNEGVGPTIVPLIALAIFFGGYAETRAASVTFSDETCGYDDYTGGVVCYTTTTYTVSINHKKSTFINGSGESLLADVYGYSQYLGCTNICDCTLQRAIEIDLAIKDSLTGATSYYQDNWQVINQSQSVQKPSLMKKLAGWFTKVVHAATTNLYNVTVLTNVAGLPAADYNAVYTITGKVLNRYYSPDTTGVISIPFVVAPGTPSVNLAFGSNMFTPPAPPPPAPACADGLDNDGDGKIDLADTKGCTNSTDNDEADPIVLTQCNDNVDNNSNGLTDYPEDPACSSPADTSEYVTGGGGGGCFIAGTQVRMADGSLHRIEDVVVGESVGTRGATNVVEKTHVRPYAAELYALNGSGNYFFTPGHPFMTTEGWKSIDPAITSEENPTLHVGKLEVGDTLVKYDGKTELITSMESKYIETNVYNLTVSGDRGFYADDYLVHNIKNIE